MDELMRRKMEEHRDGATQDFFAGHELFVLGFKTKPIRILGLQSLLQVDADFRQLVKTVEQSWQAQVWRTDFFKEALPPPWDMQVGGGYFWYLVLSLMEDLDAQRESLRTQVREELEQMFRGHRLPCDVLCDPENRDVRFHYMAQGSGIL